MNSTIRICLRRQQLLSFSRTRRLNDLSQRAFASALAINVRRSAVLFPKNSIRTLPLVRSFASSSADKRAVYVHPLSKAVLERLKSSSSSWFAEERIIYKTDGTFEHSIPEVSEAMIKTLYDKETKSHYLVLRCGKSNGLVNLLDGRKSAWQPSLDFDKIMEMTDEMIEMIQKEISSRPQP